MQVKTILIIGAIAATLTACGKIPLKGTTTDGETWVGSWIAYQSFNMTNGEVVCTGKPEDSWSDFTVRIPFKCDDGRTGVLKETKAVSGKVEATFSDGTTGSFEMGHGI